MRARHAAIDAIEIFDPMDPAVLKDPYEAYRDLREHHPVAHLEPLDVWVVSRYPDVRRVLAEPEAFSAALAFGKDARLTDTRCPGRQLNLRFAGDFGGVVSSSDGDVHIRLRRMVARLLSKPRLDAVDALVRDHAHRTVSGLRAAGTRFDVVEALAKPVATKAIGAVMGLDDELAGALATWADLTARALDPGDELSLVAAAPRLTRANLNCVRAVTAFLKTPARRDAADSPHALPPAWNLGEAPAAREETVLSLLQLFQAGYETIVSAICHIVAGSLVDRPMAVPAQGAELARVIDEQVRLASPVRATFRTAVGGQEVGGVPLPAGATLMVLIGAANRDERVFSEPDASRPGREEAHLAFGWGPHRCLGRQLAQMELTHLLQALAGQVRRLDTAGEPQVSANVLKAGFDRLPVAVEWRERTAGVPRPESDGQTGPTTPIRQTGGTER